MLWPFDHPSQQCCEMLWDVVKPVWIHFTWTLSRHCHNISFVLEMLRGFCGRLTGHGHNMSQQIIWPFDRALIRTPAVIINCHDAHIWSRFPFYLSFVNNRYHICGIHVRSLPYLEVHSRRLVRFDWAGLRALQFPCLPQSSTCFSREREARGSLERARSARVWDPLLSFVPRAPRSKLSPPLCACLRATGDEAVSMLLFCDLLTICWIIRQ